MGKIIGIGQGQQIHMKMYNVELIGPPLTPHNTVRVLPKWSRIRASVRPCGAQALSFAFVPDSAFE
jgi:hypothetical protein